MSQETKAKSKFSHGGGDCSGAVENWCGNTRRIEDFLLAHEDDGQRHIKTKSRVQRCKQVKRGFD